MQAPRITYLVKQYAAGALSDHEWAELAELLSRVEPETLARELTAAMPFISDTTPPDERMKTMLRDILELDTAKRIRPVHRVQFLRTAWFRYAAAILILLGTGVYLWNTQQKEKPLITETKPVPVKNDVQPGFDRAVLTLSNGQQVELNSAGSETIKDGGLSIQNSKGELVYGGNPPAPHGATPFSKGGVAVSPVFNTMATPKGGQYKLTLADGTKVWLNAASSVTFPTAFTGNTREVAITGEVYFEVNKNPSKPFIVKTYKDQIRVLGTSFNVNAYAGEGNIKTSLLEGAVKVNEQVLRPGQAFTHGKVVQTNTAQDIAWKNGAFDFGGMDITAVFRQLGRWYDVDIKYAGPVPSKKIRGKMGRDLKLSQVLKLLKDIGVNTKIENKTLIILPE